MLTAKLTDSMQGYNNNDTVVTTLWDGIQRQVRRGPSLVIGPPFKKNVLLDFVSNVSSGKNGDILQKKS